MRPLRGHAGEERLSLSLRGLGWKRLQGSSPDWGWGCSRGLDGQASPRGSQSPFSSGGISHYCSWSPLRGSQPGILKGKLEKNRKYWSTRQVLNANVIAWNVCFKYIHVRVLGSTKNLFLTMTRGQNDWKILIQESRLPGVKNLFSSIYHNSYIPLCAIFKNTAISFFLTAFLTTFFWF